MLLTKLLGFTRELALAYFYGATNITDAYVVVTVISGVVLAAFSSSITTSYVQFISRNKVKENIITTQLIFLLGGIVFFFSIMMILFSQFVIKIFAYGFNDDTIKITQQLMYILLPFTAITGIQYVLSAYMQVKNFFMINGIAMVISNFFIILGIICSNNNYMVLAICHVLGMLISGIFAYHAALKEGFKVELANLEERKLVVPILHLAFPIFLGQIVQQINLIIDKNFASIIGEGVITSINYANKVNTLFTTLFVSSIIVALFPSLSRLSIENKSEFNKISLKTSKIIGTFSMPVAMFLFLWSEEIIEILFLRGEFTSENVKITGEVLKIYALGIPALSVSEMLNKQFYALGDTKTPVKVSIFALVLNIINNFLLVAHFKHIGLAISTTISVFILCFMLNLLFDKKYGFNVLIEMKIKLWIVSFGTFIMGLVIIVLKNMFMDINNISVLLISGILGILAYYITLKLCKDDELKELNFLLLKLAKRNKD